MERYINMNITIVGAGNIGTQFAVHCAAKGHNVTLYTSNPNKISEHICIINEKGNEILSGDIICATDNEGVAFTNVDMIFVTMPAYCMQMIASKILPYSKEGLKIGLVPGTGGGEFAFKKCKDNGAVIFGMQRVPSVARLVKYGEMVCAIGYRDKLKIASIPSQYCKECCDIIYSVFDIPCVELKNYLNITLTPSNPILHTTRLRCLFENYKEGVTYETVPLFYEDWNDKTSELLFKCDDEVQRICACLKEFDLTEVRSLKDHYESNTPYDLTKKIRSINSFKGLKSPMIKVDGGYIPDLKSRYFTADFPYGLSILLQIAKLIEIDTPAMFETYQWYEKIATITDEFNLEKYQIRTLNDFKRFYL